MRNNTRRKIKRIKLLHHESIELCSWCKELNSCGPCHCYVHDFDSKVIDRLEDIPDDTILIVGELDE